MRGKSVKLTQAQKDNIYLLVLEGHTLWGIAKMYNCSYALICSHFNMKNHRKIYIEKKMTNGKTEPYYNNEDHYGMIPKYTFEDLSEQEKKIFFNLK